MEEKEKEKKIRKKMHVGVKMRRTMGKKRPE